MHNPVYWSSTWGSKHRLKTARYMLKALEGKRQTTNPPPEALGHRDVIVMGTASCADSPAESFAVTNNW